MDRQRWIVKTTVSFLVLALCFLCMSCDGRVRAKGIVRDLKQEPLVGADIVLQDSEADKMGVHLQIRPERLLFLRRHNSTREIQI